VQPACFGSSVAKVPTSTVPVAGAVPAAAVTVAVHVVEKFWAGDVGGQDSVTVGAVRGPLATVRLPELDSSSAAGSPG
jgi:hypothetical protein